MSVPATRSLEAVLRAGLAPDGNQLRVISGVYGTPSADARYANVVIDGQALTIPNLNAQPPGTPGQLVYVLADQAHMWVLGAMGQVTNYRMSAGVASLVFPNNVLATPLTVTHGFPIVPVAVLLQTTGSDNYVAPASVAASTFVIQGFSRTATAINRTVPVYWQAIA